MATDSMVNWRPPLGVAVIVAGFGVFVAGGLHGLWWSWLLGTLAALGGLIVGMSVFFSGIMQP